jgi:UDP-N-acetylglucosamine--N-acetylmuramyl-(pentapeptide) pyrophosphoryl-undecaprenol N-acetylglucosamine transferase
MDSNRKIKCIISGGGTGGHIFPAVAIAHEIMLRNPENEILFVGALGRMEMERVPLEGYKIIGLPIAGFNRSHLLKNILLPFKIFRSLMLSNSIIKDFKPDIVIGVGGYASFSIMKSAQAFRVPTLLQEQNSYAGKSNKILARRTIKNCVAYEGMERFFPKDRIVITGNPVRSLITNATVTRNEAIAHFSLDMAKPIVLVIGGSLGAKAINDTLLQQVHRFAEQGIQVIWQTGKLYKEQAIQAAAKYSSMIYVNDFIKDMDKAYAAADIVISRAGALSIAELCIVGKPSILVPLPTAAEDHQTVNAMALVNKNAALIVANDETDKKLVPAAISLMQDDHRKKELSENCKALAITDADKRIVNEVMKIIK